MIPYCPGAPCDVSPPLVRSPPLTVTYLHYCPALLIALHVTAL
ncbi:unnamed protein product, partial [Staurois parvus]